MAHEELDTEPGEPALPCRLPYPTTLLVDALRVLAAQAAETSCFPLHETLQRQKVQETLMREIHKDFSYEL
jgi:hypothetical protein